nr:hypothetical protein [Tanacetum cinerariifolium]
MVSSVVTGGGGGLCGGDGEWHGGGDGEWRCLAKSLSDVNFCMERGTSPSTGSSTPLRYSLGASTPQSYSPKTSRNAECSNCKHLLDKITILEATVDMYMHPEQHTVNSATLFHEVYNNMRKLDLK